MWHSVSSCGEDVCTDREGLEETAQTGDRREEGFILKIELCGSDATSGGGWSDLTDWIL